jgi:hypothetical protein
MYRAILTSATVCLLLLVAATTANACPAGTRFSAYNGNGICVYSGQGLATVARRERHGVPGIVFGDGVISRPRDAGRGVAFGWLPFLFGAAAVERGIQFLTTTSAMYFLIASVTSKDEK